MCLMSNIPSTSFMSWVHKWTAGWTLRNMVNKFLESKAETLANMNLVTAPRASKCLTRLD